MLYYHNPRCSKSRQGLALLKEKGVEPTIKEYLKEGLTTKEVKELATSLNIEPLDGLIRVKEATFKELGLSKKDSKTLAQWSKIIAENPVLLERPILKNGKRVAIGRPPENLIEIV
ncbi:arsenate reductase (glutaredoxin) [Halobacteriovorax marinus]|uniref:Arsenate reductase (Glutaredoxin) n=1 Tax=Halobacteriovorax marinus TaxID=97084 RepID=A0A1Y5F7S1_9BACT|nr:arsenate reductase (glutaredoxin) [Halobacteriovorax marinus]